MNQRLALLASLAAILAGGVARADSALTTAAAPSKKAAWLAAKAGPAGLDPAAVRAALDQRLARLVHAPLASPINLHNNWTHETVAVDATGKVALPDAELDQFLRCHFTNQAAVMDPRLLGVLVDAARHFKVSRIEIVSGFRAPKYNLMLRKKGHAVARNSQHTLGHAVDFYLPGVTTEALHAWALGHSPGGVGFYAESGFVHVDVGPRRRWNGE